MMVDIDDDAKGGYRRLEILTGPGRRRRWSADEKAQIVAETLVAGGARLRRGPTLATLLAAGFHVAAGGEGRADDAAVRAGRIFNPDVRAACCRRCGAGGNARGQFGGAHHRSEARGCGRARRVRHGRHHADRGVARGSCLGFTAMIQIPAGARVVVAIQPVDFRKGAHSLAALAAEVLAEDPFSGAVIVFRAKRADRVKILLWDTSGLVLIWKQLQHGSFRWPPIMNGVMKLSPVAFAALFDGLDWTRVQTVRGIHKPTVAA